MDRPLLPRLPSATTPPRATRHDEGSQPLHRAQDHGAAHLCLLRPPPRVVKEVTCRGVPRQLRPCSCCIASSSAPATERHTAKLRR
uniref:Uncharacterized protein n=1 Tax=Arundo donax TaxID=35708 RepID=A0A0A8YCN9_ARUDO